LSPGSARWSKSGGGRARSRQIAQSPTAGRCTGRAASSLFSERAVRRARHVGPKGHRTSATEATALPGQSKMVVSSGLAATRTFEMPRLDVIRTFKQPSKFNDAQWSLVLKAWIACSGAGSAITGAALVITYMFYVPIILTSYFRMFSFGVAFTCLSMTIIIPACFFAFWLWYLLSSLRTWRTLPNRSRA